MAIKSPEHTEWETAKKKHAAQISKKGIKFDQKLGPLLDSCFEEYRYLNGKPRPQGAPGTNAKSKALALKALSGVGAYLNRVKGLGNPAELELKAALDKFTKTLTTVSKGIYA